MEVNGEIIFVFLKIEAPMRFIPQYSIYSKTVA